ncbi:MAG: hypothetical protein BGO11_19655 [Solirubrobacterales bacterium 70-9]|nr:MAG: hypothetical protein BGO11_19655 [Solirubrobacterales bacterium 70-9]
MIAERLSFRAAADDLRLAQPALSQQMRKLEGELGVSLFDRSLRPIRLTDAGEHLLPRARSILREIDITVAELKDFSAQPRGRLTVGVMQYLTTLEVPDLLADFSSRFPAVDLGLRVGNTGQLFEELEFGEIDVMICHTDGLESRPDLIIEPMRVEELVFAVSPDHRSAGSATISIEEIADTAQITFREGASSREAMISAFDRKGLKPHIAFESGDMSTAMDLVARGFGVALVPRSVAARDSRVSTLSVAPEPLARHVAFAWRRDRHRSRALEAFRVVTHEAMDIQ